MNTVSTAPKAKSPEPKRAIAQSVNEQISASNANPSMRAASCACGGGCARCNNRKNSSRGILQAKLEVGAPDDAYEQEADRVADEILAAPSGNAIRNKAAPLIQRLTSQTVGYKTTAPPSVESVLSGSGKSLDIELQQDMSQRFGQDFSEVRIHTGAAAEQSAQEINAHAYTVGRNIVFGAGQFAPNSQQGKRLLAHELTHVVQQSNLHRLMCTRWTTYAETQPSGDYLLAGVDPQGTIDLAPVPGLTENCVFTPLFHAPEDRVANDQRLTIRATAWSLDGRTQPPVGADWRINVFEYFDPSGRGTPDYGCGQDLSVNSAFGHIRDTLTVVYPPHGGWSTRNLFVRIRNGSPNEILVRLSFEYPAVPVASEADRALDGIQTMCQMLGLIEPFGFVFDGLDVIISAARQRWVDAGISAAAMIPLGVGQASTVVRWLRRGGAGTTAETIIGASISRRLFRELSPAEILRLIRESSEFLAQARPPNPSFLLRAIGRRGEAVDGELLSFALHQRVNLAGITTEALLGRNIAVARVRVGDRVEMIATINVGREWHSETFLLREVQRLRDANRSERVILEQVFSERFPCSEGGHNCLVHLTAFEREQVRLYGEEAGRMDVFYGIPEHDRDRLTDMRTLYGLPAVTD
jgi:hypothetical protein